MPIKLIRCELIHAFADLIFFQRLLRNSAVAQKGKGRRREYF